MKHITGTNSFLYHYKQGSTGDVVNTTFQPSASATAWYPIYCTSYNVKHQSYPMPLCVHDGDVVKVEGGTGYRCVIQVYQGNYE